MTKGCSSAPWTDVPHQAQTILFLFMTRGGVQGLAAPASFWMQA